MKHKIKHHPQRFEKIAKRTPTAKSLADIGSRLGTVDELILMYRDFYKGSYKILFDMVIKHVWLEHQYTYKGLSRTGSENGLYPNQVFGYFMKNIVGLTQKPITDNLFFTAVSSYLPTFFPKFYDFNPFTDVGQFKYPYKNITIDHLSFVYQCEAREEMLAHADDKSMSYGDFRDWAINYLSIESPGEYEKVFWHNSTYMKRLKTTGKYKQK